MKPKSPFRIALSNPLSQISRGESLTKINGKQRRNIKEHSNAQHAVSSSRPMRTRARHAASNSKKLPKEPSDGSIKPSARLKRSVQRRKKPQSTDISPTDKKIASAIKSFPIPSEKEDLIEFLSVANSNIDPYTDVHDVSKISESERLISKAWKSQFDQAYSKAEHLFGNTRDFEQFKLMKESKEKELEDRQKANIAFKAILVVSWIALFLGLLGIPSALRACGAN